MIESSIESLEGVETALNSYEQGIAGTSAKLKADMEKDKAERQKAIAQEQQKLSELESELAKLNGEIVKTEGELSKAKGELQKIQDEISRVQREIAAAQAALVAAQQGSSDEEEGDGNAAEIAALQAQIAALKEQITALQAQQKKLQDDIRKKENELKKLKEQKEKVESAINDQRSKIEQMVADDKKAQNEAEQACAAAAKMENQTNGVIQRAKQALVKLRNAVAQYIGVNVRGRGGNGATNTAASAEVANGSGNRLTDRYGNEIYQGALQDDDFNSINIEGYDSSNPTSSSNDEFWTHHGRADGRETAERRIEDLRDINRRIEAGESPADIIASSSDEHYCDTVDIFYNNPSPPTLSRGCDGEIIVTDGRHRIAMAQEAGVSNIPVNFDNRNLSASAQPQSSNTNFNSALQNSNGTIRQAMDAVNNGTASGDNND